MSTENEEWRENSFNEENTGAGRDGNTEVHEGDVLDGVSASVTVTPMP